MNTRIIKDKAWDIWFSLPRCKRFRESLREEARSRLSHDAEDISIFSPNCIGGEIYSALGLKFRSPLINTSMNRNEFVEMMRKLPEYMACDIQVRKEGGKVIGTLGGGKLKPVTIRFVHDKDPEKAKADFERRKARVNYKKIAVIADDQGLSEYSLSLLGRLRFHRKAVLTAKDLSGKYPFCIRLKAYEGKEETGKYQEKTLKGVHRFELIWDYVSFLNGEENDEDSYSPAAALDRRDTENEYRACIGCK